MKKKRILSALMVLFILASPTSSLSALATEIGDLKSTSSTIESESTTEVSTTVTEEECNVDINQDVILKQEITLEQEIKVSSVPQLEDYETYVYSANNHISGSYWKPKAEEVPNLEAWVLQNGGYNSAYTGFFDLDNGQPYKPEKYVGRECEILGYDALVSSERVSDGKYHATLINENSVSREDAIMLIYKALGQYEYDYTITNKSSTGIWVFVSRSNKSNYVKRAMQDYIVNPYDNNAIPIKAGDFIVTAARLMQQYGEPVMNETETNLLLQVYGEEVPLSYGSDVTNAFCYLKARGVLNVDLKMTENLKLSDALNICMCIKDTDSRTNYKEIQLSYDLSDALVMKGYFKRTVDVGSPDVEILQEYKYEESTYFDYFLKINDTFTGFKDSEGNYMWQVFVSDTVGSNTGQYPGAYTKSMYTSATGDRYYHFIVPASYPHSNVTINTIDGSDEPEWINLPRGGGIYEVKTRNASDVNWTSTAERVSFTSMDNEEWAPYNDLERSQKKLSKAIEDYKWYDYVLDVFKPLIANAETAETVNGSMWYVNAQTTTSIFKITITHPVPTYFSDEVAKNGGTLYKEIEGIIDYLNNDKDFRNAHSFQGQIAQISNIENTPGSGKVIYTLSVTAGTKLSSEDIAHGDEQLLTEANVAEAHLKVVADIKAQKAAENANKHDEAVEKYRQHVDASITNDVFSASAICSKNLTNVMLKYSDLVDRGLFVEGTVPQPENGILTLYSKSNAIVKLNQNDHTLMVGSTIYKLTEDCAMFHYEDKNDLYVDFRSVYGWGTSKKVYFEQNGTNVQMRTGTYTESYERSVYSFPYVSGAPYQTAYKSLILGAQSESYTYNHHKLLLTSAIPYANWVVFEYYDETTAKTKAYISVYYSTHIWEVGNISGLCSASDMEAATQESIGIQNSVLGYSVFKDDEWYIRTWDLTDVKDNDGTGKIGFNRRSGFFYNIPKVHEYNHVKYLNGEYILPFYSYVGDNSVSATNDMIVNTNINGNWLKNHSNGIQLQGDKYLFTYDYGQVCNMVTEYPTDGDGNVMTEESPTNVVYSYNVFDITEDNPNGFEDSGSPTSGTMLGTLNTRCLAPSAIFAYFGGFPKEYISTKDVKVYNNALFYLGSRNATAANSSAFDKYRLFKYLGATITVSASTDLKFYKVADDGSTSVYVYMGDTANLSISLDEQEDEVVEVLDADTTKQFKGWDQFGMNYLLHSVDSGLTWLIVFIFKVVPLVMMCAVSILLGLSFMSQNRLALWFSKNVVDLVHVLTLGRATQKEWTFRRGFWFMLIAYIVIALLFNGNFLLIVQWMVSWYQELVDFMRVNR